MSDHTSDASVAPPPRDRRPTGWVFDHRRWEHATLREATVHGVRLFNVGAYHEAHDCFEAEWFNYGTGTTESAFLHGMVQVAAGCHKRDAHDSERGLRSLFRTARSYLEGVPADFYGVDVDGVRDTIEAALSTPAIVDDWQLSLDGDRPTAIEADFAYARARE